MSAASLSIACLLGGSAPMDQRKPLYKHLDQGLIYLCLVLLPFGLLFLIALLIFNIVTINKTLVK